MQVLIWYLHNYLISMFSNRFRYIYILLLAIYSYLNILFTEGDRLFSGPISPTLLFLSILSIVLLVWESNRFLSGLLLPLEVRIPTRIHILIPFFFLSLVHVTFIAIMFGTLVPEILGMENTNIFIQLKLSLAFAFRINLFLHTLHAITYFSQKLRDSRLEAEQLKTLHAESQFEALRNQINPHFLFNSFNVLSGLITKDTALASEFIQQLSRVYRYLLYNNDQKLVTLSAENKFIDAYIFLLKIRFGKPLNIQKNLNQLDQPAYHIPPASVQLLLENAVKHNIISKKTPLQIDIFIENEFLVVKNNLQLKPQIEMSGGLGLNNIELRYQHMTHKRVVVKQNTTHFVVMLPLFKQPDL